MEISQYKIQVLPSTFFLLIFMGCQGTDINNGQPTIEEKQETDTIDFNLKYADVVPILDKNCVPCHRPIDANGDVRFDTYLLTQLHSEKAAKCLKGQCPTSQLSTMPPGIPRWEDEDKNKLIWYFENGAPE